MIFMLRARFYVITLDAGPNTSPALYTSTLAPYKYAQAPTRFETAFEILAR